MEPVKVIKIIFFLNILNISEVSIHQQTYKLDMAKHVVVPAF
jgi:hypothetical protein